MQSSPEPQVNGAPGSPGGEPVVPRRAVAVVVAVLGGLFGLFTWQVLAEGPLWRFDERLGDAVRGGGFPRGLAEVFADLGNVWVAVPVLVGVIGFVYRRTRQWRAPLAAVLVLAAVPAVVAPLKALTDRAGPPGMGDGGFYPSGHAATAVVAYGAVVLLLLPHTRHGRPLIGAAVLLVIANGFGLVRSGYHWPLDVAASWCLGGLLLVVPALLPRRGHGRTGGRCPD